MSSDYVSDMIECFHDAFLHLDGTQQKELYDPAKMKIFTEKCSPGLFKLITGFLVTKHSRQSAKQMDHHYQCVVSLLLQILFLCMEIKFSAI